MICLASAVMAQENKLVYTCPMHPEVQMEKPGNCPKCGMTLVKKTVTVKKPKSKQGKKEPAPVTAKDTSKLMKEEHMQMDVGSDTMKPKIQMAPAKNMKGMNMEGMDKNHHMSMSHVYSVNLPMERNGSGTAWLPDASPMYSHMIHKNGWMYMLHYNLFVRYNKQDLTNKGSRGNTKIDAPDFVMLMAQHQVGENGLFHYSIMSSLDALTGSNGYPLLFQSGEAYKGKPIVDRQHPHDLFSELSVSYAQALSQMADIYAYLGYPGEPALGPVAFMHRPSAMDNPDAPISHHWADATHVTFGVATIGVRYGLFKIEASSFTGREPNENRYDFDRPRFDSWSGRLSFNPTANWALQLSHGFIKSPELLQPGEDVKRTTASAIYSKTLSSNGTVNAAAVWGVNKSNDHEGENALLFEGEWRKNKWALHSRYEWVQKGIEELSLNENTYGKNAVFAVNALTAGFNYDLLKLGGSRLAGGGQWTLYHADERLDPLYGHNPFAVEVYLRLYPAMSYMKMKKRKM